MITNSVLIKKAKSLAHKRRLSESMSTGYVACALETDKHHVYVGTSIESACGVGNCAESSAIAAMLTAGEQRIARIVAVDAKGNVLPPCGRCREVIRQADEKNVETNVILHIGKMVKLKKLLPHIWQDLAYPKHKK